MIALRARERRAGRRWIVLSATLTALLLASCTSDDEPEPDTPSSTASASPSESDPTATEDPPGGLPVAGSFVVRGTDTGAPVRFAVHSVRRVAGGSVLDYSVTALPSGDLAAGDELGSGTDLDFDAFVNAPNVNLIDVDASQVYRPLANAEGACVCTFVYTTGLVVGETELHQAAYPVLPDDMSEVTVEFGNGPLLEAVPVLEEGTVSSVAEEVDLAAAAPELPVAASSRGFSHPISAPYTEGSQSQPLRIDVNQVLSGPGGTTMLWTIHATGAGAGLTDTGTPISDHRLAPVTVAFKTGVASGPGLRPSDDPDAPVTRAWFATVKAKGSNTLTGVKPGDWRFCLCTDYQNYGDGVDKPGESRTFVSHLPPLPEATTTVDVVFPDDSLPAIEGVPVEAAATSALGEPQSAAPAQWSLPEGGMPKEPFTVDDWPTPVPDEASISGITPVVDDLLVKQSLPGVQREQQERQVEVTLDSTISFQPDSAALTSTAREGIARLADQIDDEAEEGSAVSIEGHVAGSDQGSVAFQRRLSSDRAQAVLAELQPQVEVDVDFSAKGFGAERPLVPNDTEANRRLNRRVVVIFTSTEK